MTEQARRPSSLFIHSRSSVKEMGSGAMGKAPKTRKKPKERWLLTRKTWRYMADAGRKLIPDGALNRTEDVPKIEAYFQQVCTKEPRFLLWRKGSYPGALAFKSHRRKRDRRFGGSCRTKAYSSDDIKSERHPSDLATIHHSGSRFDIHKLKYDFLSKLESPSTSKLPTTHEEELEDNQLVSMLEKYLNISSQGASATTSQVPSTQVDYQELVDRLKRLSDTYEQEHKGHSSFFHKRIGLDSTKSDKTRSHTHKELYDTLNRYFSKSTNRDKVISNLLTDRKLLENLYFDLRKTKGFGARSASVKSTGYLSQDKSQWRASLLHDKYDSDDEFDNLNEAANRNSQHLDDSSLSFQSQTKKRGPIYYDFGIQTDPISDAVLAEIDEEYKKAVAKQEEEAREAAKMTSPRRRSSVDHDDVSQSVSDTIKRYLRMARKKSSDAEKADRFKRINYDKNLRNIKAKNVVDSPSEDDDTNKGCQTEEPWTVSYRDYRAREVVSSPSEAASSCDELGSPVSPRASCPSSPPPGLLSQGQSFLQHLLHGKHDKGSAAPAMQKSKSSSSVVHHGGRLVAKRIFRSRSKSQSRLQTTPSAWTPQVSISFVSVLKVAIH